MRINNLNSQNFGILYPQPAVVNRVPEVVPAIIRHVGIAKTCEAEKFIPKAADKFIRINTFTPARDMFILHEAILPDTKIRVVGLRNKAERFLPAKNARNTGRKNPVRLLRS